MQLFCMFENFILTLKLTIKKKNNNQNNTELLSSNIR